MSDETRAKIAAGRRRQELLKTSRHGLYATTVPAELRDVVHEVDSLVDNLVEQLGGPQAVRASEWLLLNQLRSAQIVVGGVFRFAAAKGLVGDKGDLVDCLKRVGSFTNTVRLCLLQLKLTGTDGEPGPNIAERLRAIEVKGGKDGGE